MSTLTGLKLVTAANQKPMSTIEIKRAKLISKLREQQVVFEHKRSGQPFTTTVTKTVVDAVTGEQRVVEKPKRVREWFWRNDAGKWNLQLRYGAKPLILAKGGKNAIEIDNAEAFAKTVNALIDAVNGGELDAAMAEASAQTRKGFGK